MEVEREPVRLVADALKQAQCLGVVGDRHRARAAGHEHLLDPLREADHRYVTSLEQVVIGEPGEAAHPGRELSLAAVDHDQVGHRAEALVAVSVVG